MSGCRNRLNLGFFFIGGAALSNCCTLNDAEVEGGAVLPRPFVIVSGRVSSLKPRSRCFGMSTQMGRVPLATEGLPLQILIIINLFVAQLLYCLRRHCTYQYVTPESIYTEQQVKKLMCKLEVMLCKQHYALLPQSPSFYESSNAYCNINQSIAQNATKQAWCC